MSLLQDTYTMWLRDMLRYRKNWRYLIFQFIFPLMIIVIIGFGLGNIVSLGKDLSYIDFLSSGFLVFMIANGGLGGGFNLIEERNNGFLKEVIVAPISRSSIILGKVAARFTLGTVQVIAIVLILSTMANLSLAMFHITLLALILMTLLFVCLGVVMAAYFQDVEVFRTIQGMVVFPLMFISGIFFPVDKLPGWLAWIAYVNPITYAVDLFRYSVIGHNIMPIWLDITLLLVLSSAAFFLSVWLFDRKFRE